MKTPKSLWITFSIVVLASFLVLGLFGWNIYHKAPPVPDRVVSSTGEVLFTGQDIKDTIFAVGTIALGIFVLGLKTGWSVNKGKVDISEENYPTVRQTI